MPSHEFTYWLAYNRIDPIGSMREDWRIGQLTCLMANRYRGKNKPARPLSEFMWQDVRQARKSKLLNFRDFLRDKIKPRKKP